FSDDINIVIQDGGSAYDVSEVISQYPHLKAMISFTQESDKGIYDAMNKAVSRCKTDFVMFLNCGDCLAGGMQEVLLLALKNIDSQFGCVKFLADVCGEGITIERATRTYFFRRMLNHQSIIYRKEIFEDVGFDENLNIVGDLKHFLEAKLSDSVSYIDIVLIKYMNGGVASNSRGIRQNWIERSSAWRWNIKKSQKIIILLGVVIRFLLYFSFVKR
ncbi:hypothetical protein N9W03_07075, partial [Planktomarina temperata]|nr:hypothetical protein [Planktomarina temperata]